MSDITDVNHIECNTIQDVFDKYTSKEAKQAYSYRLCNVTMDALSGTDYDDYSSHGHNLGINFGVNF